jgi:hypothetical protein
MLPSPLQSEASRDLRDFETRSGGWQMTRRPCRRKALFSPFDDALLAPETLPVERAVIQHRVGG